MRRPSEIVDTDPLHDGGATTATWTTVNAAEAMPGVPTPLGWTWFFESCELGLRGAFADIGAIPAADVRIHPDLDDRFVGIFYGHFAGNLDMMRHMGDQMPGSSGDAVEEQLFGRSRPGMRSTREGHRLPVVAAKLPTNAWRSHRRIRRLSRQMTPWWQRMVADPSSVPAGEARTRFRQAQQHVLTTVRAHTVVSMVGQGLYEQTRRLCVTAGMPGLELRLLGAGNDVAERQMIEDLWGVASGARSMATFLHVHGFHGPAEGELSSPSWREDPAPLEALLAAYRDRGRPEEVAQQEAERGAAESQLLRELRRRDRSRARLVLRLARSFIPLREEGRGTFLKAYDVARAMARRIGEDLAARGVLTEPGDVFYLTVEELLGDDPMPDEPKAAVAHRRARREEYLEVELPERWTGMPEAVPLDTPLADDGPPHDGGAGSLRAVGVSPGQVEGRALVVTDPGDPGEVSQGDILVCRTTDPSWASLFYVVDACVIDVGGPMSHGAILARELGLPCVINTREGTRRIRTGDRLRVDGDAGTVDILR